MDNNKYGNKKINEYFGPSASILYIYEISVKIKPVGPQPF